MTYNPEIFRGYDIRGVYGRDFDDDFAFRLGAAFVRYLNRRKFLVANDERDFSKGLAESLMNGIISAGADVEYVGLSSLPFFHFALNKTGANGGVMITASHNPPEYGGFKFFRGDGSQIDSENGLDSIKELLATGAEISKYGGRISREQTAGIKEDYIKYVKDKSCVKPGDLRGMRIKVGEGGTGADDARNLLESFGVQCDEAGFDVAFSFDADADRLIVQDGAGEQIRPDLIFGLIVKDKRGFFSRPKVVHTLDFSKGVLEKFKEWGIKVYESKVGSPHIRELMVKRRADYGGESSGHILFKDNNYCELPLAAMLMILKIMAHSASSGQAKSINELVEPFMTWFNSGEINIVFSNEHSAFRGISERLKEKYKDGGISELDGITIEYNNPADSGASWWFNLRPSNTEPVLRLVVEAKTSELLENKVKEILDEINKK